VSPVARQQITCWPAPAIRRRIDTEGLENHQRTHCVQAISRAAVKHPMRGQRRW
jgi:hypothetical protein